MFIDFGVIARKEAQLSDIQGQYTHQDLINATNEMIDTVLAMVRDLPDSYVSFQPVDSQAQDNAAATEAEKDLAWNLGHVVVHLTASGEEAAAQGAQLARGVPVRARNRYEVPWEMVTTTAQLIHRLEESRRMRLAYLNAWPDEPHYELLHDKGLEHYGAINCVGFTLLGLKHDADHLGQIAEIIAQARAAEV
ncbi:MAG: DinB family protein [Anaerolineae bacterium]|nr:DinB family protein [Anaerolineae bacterium]